MFNLGRKNVLGADGNDWVRVPRGMAVYDVEALMNHVYPDDVLLGDPMELLNRMIICPLNSDVDMINGMIYGRMLRLDPLRPNHTYPAAHQAPYNYMDPASQAYSMLGLQEFTHSSLPAPNLHLCVGMPVMCMRNLNVEDGIANGKIMIVEELRENVVICRVRNRFGREWSEPIHPVKFAFDDSANDSGKKFFRIQLPLRPCFAGTVHRSQGGTFGYVGYHALNIFDTFGMTFVAVSRCTSRAGLKIFCLRPQNENELPMIRNCVWQKHHTPAGSDDSSDETTPRQTPAPSVIHSDEPVFDEDTEEIDDQLEMEFGAYDSDEEAVRYDPVDEDGLPFIRVMTDAEANNLIELHAQWDTRESDRLRTERDQFTRYGILPPDPTPSMPRRPTWNDENDPMEIAYYAKQMNLSYDQACKEWNQMREAERTPIVIPPEDSQFLNNVNLIFICLKQVIVSYFRSHHAMGRNRANTATASL